MATLVAAVELYDRLLRKPLPQISYSMAADAGVGNHILLMNAGSVPIMITSWMIYWAKPKRFTLQRRYALEEVEFDDIDPIILQLYSAETLSFTDGRHFDWGHQKAAVGQLYIELNLLNRRRPVILYVYNPDPEKSGEPASWRRLLPHGLRPSPALIG